METGQAGERTDNDSKDCANRVLLTVGICDTMRLPSTAVPVFMTKEQHSGHSRAGSGERKRRPRGYWIKLRYVHMGAFIAPSVILEVEHV